MEKNDFHRELKKRRIIMKMKRISLYLMLFLIFAMLSFIQLGSSDSHSLPMQNAVEGEKNTTELELGTILTLNKQKFKVVAKGKKTFEYTATEKELWIYTYGVISMWGGEPKMSKFTHQIEVKKGEIVKVVPSKPEIFVNGKISEFSFPIMKVNFEKFKNQIMLLIEKQK